MKSYMIKGSIEIKMTKIAFPNTSKKGKFYRT